MALWPMGCERRDASDVRLCVCSIFRVVPFAETDHELHFRRQGFGVGIIERTSFLSRSVCQFPLGNSARTVHAWNCAVVCDTCESFRHPIAIQDHRCREPGSCRYIFVRPRNAGMAACSPDPMAAESRAKTTIQSGRPLVRHLRDSSRDLDRSLFFSLQSASAMSGVYRFIQTGRSAGGFYLALDWKFVCRTQLRRFPPWIVGYNGVFNACLAWTELFLARWRLENALSLAGSRSIWTHVRWRDGSRSAGIERLRGYGVEVRASQGFLLRRRHRPRIFRLFKIIGAAANPLPCGNFLHGGGGWYPRNGMA